MVEPIIRLVDVEKCFRGTLKPVYALRHINLTIRRGDIFGIIGKSGAGKSTLVRCINMLERPTGGQVFFQGRDMCTLKPAELRQARRQMGMIFQQFNLLMQRTAEGNVCFPMELAGVRSAEAHKRAQELLEMVGLSDRIKSYPSQLSGGQKQRVAIARALATNPQVLLCDEATSALDPATTESILRLIADINQHLGITAVVITHEMSVIEKICHNVAIISHGEIAETGPVETVFFHPQTDVARQLVMPEAMQRLDQEQMYRIIFNGRSSLEPVIGNIVLACGSPVNIMFADTCDIGGKAYGQMVLQLPDARVAERFLNYVREQGLTVEAMQHV